MYNILIFQSINAFTTDYFNKEEFSKMFEKYLLRNRKMYTVQNSKIFALS